MSNAYSLLKTKKCGLHYRNQKLRTVSEQFSTEENSQATQEKIFTNSKSADRSNPQDATNFKKILFDEQYLDHVWAANRLRETSVASTARVPSRGDFKSHAGQRRRPVSAMSRLSSPEKAQSSQQNETLSSVPVRRPRSAFSKEKRIHEDIQSRDFELDSDGGVIEDDDDPKADAAPSISTPRILSHSATTSALNPSAAASRTQQNRIPMQKSKSVSTLHFRLRPGSAPAKAPPSVSPFQAFLPTGSHQRTPLSESILSSENFEFSSTDGTSLSELIEQGESCTSTFARLCKELCPMCSYSLGTLFTQSWQKFTYLLHSSMASFSAMKAEALHCSTELTKELAKNTDLLQRLKSLESEHQKLLLNFERATAEKDQLQLRLEEFVAMGDLIQENSRLRDILRSAQLNLLDYTVLDELVAAEQGNVRKALEDAKDRFQGSIPTEDKAVQATGSVWKDHVSSPTMEDSGARPPMSLLEVARLKPRTSYQVLAKEGDELGKTLDEMERDSEYRGRIVEFMEVVLQRFSSVIEIQGEKPPLPLASSRPPLSASPRPFPSFHSEVTCTAQTQTVRIWSHNRYIQTDDCHDYDKYVRATVRVDPVKTVEDAGTVQLSADPLGKRFHRKGKTTLKKRHSVKPIDSATPNTPSRKPFGDVVLMEPTPRTLLSASSFSSEHTFSVSVRSTDSAVGANQRPIWGRQGVVLPVIWRTILAGRDIFIPAMERTELHRLINSIYSHRLDCEQRTSSNSSHNAMPHTFAACVVEFLMQRHGFYRILVSSLSELAESIFRHSHESLRVRTFARFCGMDENPLSPSALQVYLRLQTQIRPVLKAPPATANQDLSGSYRPPPPDDEWVPIERLAQAFQTVVGVQSQPQNLLHTISTAHPQAIHSMTSQLVLEEEPVEDPTSTPSADPASPASSSLGLVSVDASLLVCVDQWRAAHEHDVTEVTNALSSALGSSSSPVIGSSMPPSPIGSGQLDQSLKTDQWGRRASPVGSVLTYSQIEHAMRSLRADLPLHMIQGIFLEAGERGMGADMEVSVESLAGVLIWYGLGKKAKMHGQPQGAPLPVAPPVM